MKLQGELRKGHTAPMSSPTPSHAPRPPLRDVAALAEVSEPTVSRVLNGRPGVAPTTRERVVAALRSLGFEDVPDPQRPRSGVVGMVCGDYLNPAFGMLTHHISTELARKGWLTTVAVADPDLAPEEQCVEQLCGCGVDGIVFVAGRHAEIGAPIDHYRSLLEEGRPIVLVNGGDTGLHVPHVRCDEEAGARKAVEHLISLGHTRIGCVLGSPAHVPTARFVAGYHQALAGAGLVAPPGSISHTPFTFEGGRAGASRLLARGITALIAGNDLMALGAIAASNARGGEPVSVVGYDGTDLTALTAPALTTLRQPFEDMAQMIADAIVDEICGRPHAGHHYVFQPVLVARESTHGLRPEFATG